MRAEFKLYDDKDKVDVLQMMTSFNQIDGYKFDLRTREENLDSFTSNNALGRLYLIRSKQQNVGYIVLAFGFSFEYEGRDAFIDELYIEEDYRNQGIGKLAMDFVESESRKLEVRAVHLEVEKHNGDANRLYRNKGFTSNNRILMTKRTKL